MCQEVSNSQIIFRKTCRVTKKIAFALQGDFFITQNSDYNKIFSVSYLPRH